MEIFMDYPFAIPISFFSYSLGDVLSNVVLLFYSLNNFKNSSTEISANLMILSQDSSFA